MLNGKTKTVIAVSIVAVGGIFAILLAISMTNNTNDLYASKIDIRSQCAEEVKNYLGYENEYSTELCVALVEQK